MLRAVAILTWPLVISTNAVTSVARIQLRYRLGGVC